MFEIPIDDLVYKNHPHRKKMGIARSVSLWTWFEGLNTLGQSKLYRLLTKGSAAKKAHYMGVTKNQFQGKAPCASF